MSVENQYLLKAQVYQRPMKDEFERERSAQTVLIENQRCEIDFLKNHSQNRSQEGERILSLRRDLEDLKVKHQRTLDAVIISKRENDRLKRQVDALKRRGRGPPRSN